MSRLLWISRTVAVSTLVTLIGLALPWQASAADASGDDAESASGKRRVAVVSFDRGTEAGALMETVSDLLDRAKYDVVAGGRLEGILAEHQAGEVDEKVASQFAGISNQIGDGVKSFFYKGNETAVEELTPIFDLGMGHPEVLVRRPDFAEQIFQSGIVLVRAYKNLNREEKAQAVVRQLVRTLPGREPSPSTAPPNVIRFFEKERARVAEEGTRLELKKVGGSDCQAYLNGTAVGTEPIAVAAGEPYYMTLECGTTQAPVWHTTLQEGEERTVPVSGANPMRFTMESGNFQNRKLAEDYMRMISHWTEIPQVLGIKQRRAPDATGAEGDGNGVLVVRVDGDGSATWSDTRKSDEIRRAITRVMPGYQSSGAAAAGGTNRRDSGGRMRWLDWTLLGGGVAVLGGGTVFGVVTENRSRAVQCSPDTGANPSNCEGVPTLRFDGDEEVRRAEREVATARVGYISALVVGAGLTTWGIVRFANRGSDERRAASFGVLPSPNGASAHLQLRW